MHRCQHEPFCKKSRWANLVYTKGPNLTASERATSYETTTTQIAGLKLPFGFIFKDEKHIAYLDKHICF